MLEKLKSAIGIAKRMQRIREISRREISRIGYSEKQSKLIVEFTDGTMHTHLDVLEGHIVGLRVAADKLDFYESQIEPLNPALEVSKPGGSENVQAQMPLVAEREA